MRDYVHPRRLSLREAFVPLAHPAGHAQADFREAWAVIGGVTRKLRFLVVALPHSDAIFVKAYPAETAEAFCDGHVAAFAFFGGVPQSILYDNTRLAVAKILGDGTRKRSTLFAALQFRDLGEKAGTDRARCVFDGAARNRWQEVRLWVFGCAGKSDNVSR